MQAAISSPAVSHPAEATVWARAASPQALRREASTVPAAPQTSQAASVRPNETSLP